MTRSARLRIIKMAGGRPTKMTPETISKLEAAFLLGCTDEEACLAADIGKMTLYRYQDDNPEFRDRKEELKSNPVYKARKVVMQSLDEGDINTAQKVLDRKEGSKVKLTGKVEHEHEHSHKSVSDTSEWITGMLGIGQEEPSTQSNKN